VAREEQAEASERIDGRRARGRQTRTSILHTAADLASVEGLDGLTIGRLATELGMSKSGLFAHFGSKEELQLATNAAAVERFTAHVIEPALEQPRGRGRLDALVGGWLAYLRAGVFPGGCYFGAVRAEFDSRPPGPVRDAIAEDQRRWQALLARTVGGAQEVGDLSPGVDPLQLAFEIEALGSSANVQFQLLGDPVVFDRAATAIAARLDALATS
jgi:AcrR family transcriptional regulator